MDAGGGREEGKSEQIGSQFYSLSADVPHGCPLKHDLSPVVLSCQVTAYPDLMNILVRVASSQAFHAYMKVRPISMCNSTIVGGVAAECTQISSIRACTSQAKDETLADMVTAGIDILGYKSMADFWALQQWRQKSKKSKLVAADKLQNASPRGNDSSEVAS
jgi:hypothetical protein